jgi:plastocyanin
MFRKLTALAVALAAAALAACAGHGGGATGNSFALPGMPDLQITATLPDGATSMVSEELPGEGLGTVNDPHWQATLGGYTQQQFSQALGFPPGTKLTIKNISKSISHTLNVVKKIKRAPAKFPPDPSLGMSPSGGTFGIGYRSGVIAPGHTVTVKLRRAGIYLFGCAFHYHEGMQDVFVVATGATPGPQGTAPAR